MIRAKKAVAGLFLSVGVSVFLECSYQLKQGLAFLAVGLPIFSVLLLPEFEFFSVLFHPAFGTFGALDLFPARLLRASCLVLGYLRPAFRCFYLLVTPHLSEYHQYLHGQKHQKTNACAYGEELQVLRPWLTP